MTVFGAAIRGVVGGTLAWWVGLAVVAPQVTRATALAAVVIGAATLWRPGAGLLLVAALAPAGTLLAPAPVRATELLAWALLAGWLLRVWRPLSPAPWPAAVTFPAALYGAALVASWLALTVGGAAGVPDAALPPFLAHAIPSDYVMFSSPEPETWTLLQSLTGLAMLLASMGIARGDARLARALAWTIAASLAVVAAATLVDVARQWAEAGYGGWFLLRYVRGERFSLLADLNAAGSLYVLAGLTAAAPAVLARGRRYPWLIPLLVIVAALWLTGSRTSFLAAIGGLVILAVAQRRWPLTRRQIAVSVTVVSLVLLAAAATMDWQPDVRGSAGRAANLRSQFLATSVRMFASSPLSGVGVGRYFDRSPEFMPAGLRELYGNENAHNYFVQQFAELGVVGGLLFLWLAIAITSAAWTAARDPDTDPVLLGLFAGTGAYLLTCLTGHPLLVPQAALPFWIGAGVLAGIGAGTPPRGYARRAIALVAAAILVAGVARAAMSYARVTAPPREYGFHEVETAPDGTTFRWMTRHAVTYIPDGAGFVRLRMRAPDVEMSAPLVVETSIAGRVTDRRAVPAGRWVSYDVPARALAPAPFRRVDFRTNQAWTQEISLGRRRALRPIAVMLEEMRWIPLDEVGR